MSCCLLIELWSNFTLKNVQWHANVVYLSGMNTSGNWTIALNKVFKFTITKEDFHNLIKNRDIQKEPWGWKEKKEKKRYCNSFNATSVVLAHLVSSKSFAQKMTVTSTAERQVRDFQAFHFESHWCRNVYETLNKLQSGCLVLEQVFTKPGRLNMQSMGASACHSNLLYLLRRPPSREITNTFRKGQRKAARHVHYLVLALGYHNYQELKQALELLQTEI